MKCQVLCSIYYTEQNNWIVFDNRTTDFPITIKPTSETILCFFNQFTKNTSHLCRRFVCLHTMVHYKRLNLIIEVLNHILSIYIIVIINDILSNHECITSYDGLNDKSHTAAGRSYWTLHTFITWRQR